MTPRRYATPLAFKQALDQRLRESAGAGNQFSRKRQILVFERLLARIGLVFGESVALKGGLALELRLERARTTKDVDLRMTGSPVDVLERLREAAGRDLDDFMKFEVQADTEHPEIHNEGLRYEGLRFRVLCKIAGKQYAYPFGVDIVFGEPHLGNFDTWIAEDFLDFAGIAPPTFRLYPIETHIAEKLHAYTMPRIRPNSRVKDFPDLALLASVRTLDARILKAALEQTFSFRKTHPLPASTPIPPGEWAFPYSNMAREDRLEWPTLESVTKAVQSFMDPILSDNLDATWVPSLWQWHRKKSTPPPP
ncbi:MAG TPA: nucleotidyl transferase AbiEii/AbiGii toxin family protein [Fibrobacteria bacterium]|nr:nucleotidyl transferase AbiEii/AbiGii toxin family protein [Fibrobacteria bacterium]